MEREVMTTSLGSATPLGTIGIETWNTSRECGGGRISRFNLEETGLRTTIAYEVNEAPPISWESASEESRNE